MSTDSQRIEDAIRERHELRLTFDRRPHNPAELTIDSIFLEYAEMATDIAHLLATLDACRAALVDELRRDAP